MNRARIGAAMLITIIILIIVISIELFGRTPNGVPVEINDARYNVVEIEGMTCISGSASLTCNWAEWEKRNDAK